MCVCVCVCVFVCMCVCLPLPTSCFSTISEHYTLRPVVSKQESRDKSSIFQQHVKSGSPASSALPCEGQSGNQVTQHSKDTEGHAGDENTISPVPVTLSADIVVTHVTGRKCEICLCTPIVLDLCDCDCFSSSASSAKFEITNTGTAGFEETQFLNMALFWRP